MRPPFLERRAFSSPGAYSLGSSSKPPESEPIAKPGCLQGRVVENVGLNNAVPAASAGTGTTDNTSPNVLIQLYGAYT